MQVNPPKIIVFLLLFTALFFYMNYKHIPEEAAVKNSGLFPEIIQVDSGYGYQIKHKERILIRQEYIPCVRGKIVFSTPTEAKKVANLIIDKLVHNQSPEVLPSELEALKITVIK